MSQRKNTAFKIKICFN